MTLDEIKLAITRLSADERARLRRWLATLDAGEETSPTANAAEKLGRLAGRAFADVKKRMREP